MADTDKNIKIVIGPATFYFPAANIHRELTKNILLLKLPKRNVGRDFLRSSEQFRISGVWRDDDVDKLYDSLTAVARYESIRNYAKNGRVGGNIGMRCYLSWGDYKYTTFIKGFKATKTSGQGTDIEYILTLIREVRNDT